MARVSRRSFIEWSLKGVVAASAVGGVGGAYAFNRRRWAGGSKLSVFDLAKHGPIVDTQLIARDSVGFTGDDPTRAHGALWKIESILARAGLSGEPDERVDCAILGGGMSGLLSAHFLRAQKPLILEFGYQLGGNSRGENWQGIDSSIGAAYISRPDEGAPIQRLLEELGVWNRVRFESATDGGTVLMGGQFRRDYWNQHASAQARADYARFHAELARVYEQEYPEVPYRPESGIPLELFERLDRMSLEAWAQEKFGTLHADVVSFVRRYCWSSFGGDWNEVSAWQGLNFLAADQAAVGALPGGNAAIAQALASRLATELGEDRLRVGCTVIQVDAGRSDGVLITYVGPDDQVHRVLAQKVVMAMPKFIAKKLLVGVNENDGGAREAAMSRLKYRAYRVTNVELNAPVNPLGYEIYTLPTTPAESDPRQLAYTDLIFAAWAAGGAMQTGRSVLTLYRAYPYEGGRPQLFRENPAQDRAALMQAGFPAVLTALGLQENQVADVRFSRFGHALPLAEPGLLADGVTARASAPLGERIAFAHQDVFANPCFESAFNAARAAADWMLRS